MEKLDEKTKEKSMPINRMEETVFLTNIESENCEFYSQPTKSVLSKVSSHRIR